jgi:hypothetical protein
MADAHTEARRYREMANDIRALVPTLKHTEAAGDLRLLGIRYQKLADYLAADHGTVREHRLQAG